MRKRKLPKFRRQEWFMYKRLGEKWRRPKGKNSKMRLGIKGKPSVVSIGYRNPKRVRGFHPSGLKEVLVESIGMLDEIDPKTQAVRISSRIGKKKRLQLIARARELGLRILNLRRDEIETEHSTETGS